LSPSDEGHIKLVSTIEVSSLFFSYTASLDLFILDVATTAVRERRFLVSVCNNNACFSSAVSGVFVTLLLVHALLEGGANQRLSE
jgi:hypothetical protein